MALLILILASALAIRSVLSCSRTCYSKLFMDVEYVDTFDEATPLGRDKFSGSVCKEQRGVFSFCSGGVAFPQSFNFTGSMFLLKFSQVSDVKKGDLVRVSHVRSLVISYNKNFSRLENGSFYDLVELRNLSMAHNPQLRSLEAGVFEGLVNLEQLRLVANGFVTLDAVTPTLPLLPNLIRMNLAGNNFQEVREGDFEVLRGSKLEELSLVSSNVKRIDVTAFNPISNLGGLFLGANHFNTSTLLGIIEETAGKLPLHTLSLLKCKLDQASTKRVLQAVAATNVSTLCLAYNLFESITTEVFPEMPKLEYLDLSEVKLSRVTNDAFSGLPQLKTLILGGNTVGVPQRGLLLTQLTHLDLHSNFRNQNFVFDVNGPKFINMTSLVILNLSYNRLQILYNDSFVGLESLRTLLLKNALISGMHNTTFAPLYRLEHLNLEDNLFAKGGTFHHQELFRNLTNLRSLRLGGCSITYLENAFRNLTQLEYLGLGRNKLTTLPNFETMRKLRSVDLSSNALQTWKKSVFSRNNDLEEVNVGSNKFTHLTSHMVEDFNNLKKLNLTDNPFMCDCYLDWNTDKIMNLIKFETILCAFPETTTGLTIRQFLHMTHHCLNVALLVSLVVFTATLGAAAFTVYYFRWHLKYWLFLTRLHLRRTLHVYKKQQATTPTSFLYDAFVSYSCEDRDFVAFLTKMLEDNPPYISLCVYERDFEIGTMIPENILQSVSRSRKTILVISDSYAKSKWCRFECQIAECNRLIRHNGDGKYVSDNVIFIKLGAVNDAHLTPMLKYLLKTRIYLQWDADEKKQKIFWEKLRKVLAPPTKVEDTRF